MSADMDKSSWLFRIRRTALEMLRDRGFRVQRKEIDMDKAQFLDEFGDNVKRKKLTIIKPKKDDPSDQIYVFFPSRKKFEVKHIKKYIVRMKAENVTRAIFIVEDVPSIFARRSIQDISQKYQLEIFEDSELLVNVTKHKFVPEHQVLTDEEKKKLLDWYALKETQLPRIHVTDPAARYHGLKRGQVVKIIRPSETAGKYVTYRYVI